MFTRLHLTFSAWPCTWFLAATGQLDAMNLAFKVRVFTRVFKRTVTQNRAPLGECFLGGSEVIITP